MEADVLGFRGFCFDATHMLAELDVFSGITKRVTTGVLTFMLLPISYKLSLGKTAQNVAENCRSIQGIFSLFAQQSEYSVQTRWLQGTLHRRIASFISANVLCCHIRRWSESQLLTNYSWPLLLVIRCFTKLTISATFHHCDIDTFHWGIYWYRVTNTSFTLLSIHCEKNLATSAST